MSKKNKRPKAESNQPLHQAIRVKAAREAGAVERCHTIPHVRPYGVDRHTYGVCCLLYILFPGDAPRLLPYALFHDFPERWTGDIPAQVLRNHPAIKEATTAEDRRIAAKFGLPCEHDLKGDDLLKLKACDRLEFWLWCADEVITGSQLAVNGMVAIEEHIREFSPVPEVLALMEAWTSTGPRLPEVV